MVKNVLLSVLAGLLAALASWIVTVNLYTTVKAFQHPDAAPAHALRWGFAIASLAGVAVFIFTLYRLTTRRRGRTSAK